MSICNLRIFSIGLDLILNLEKINFMKETKEKDNQSQEWLFTVTNIVYSEFLNIIKLGISIEYIFRPNT